ncbi:hypothetical protein JJB07_17975 [Tumebacillus sp. ITR2]|uniref:Type II CBASS E2 protein domain-containing protein n=1 Tax=Tumebacillus amylolyticus TaxID=2801339 RepID=A0ABS1JDY0_9BACL|nr:hypothetical protein [Tumebacillus amylolyticus]MBL0388494.1 hypothetical protein [Tumebacillus amylolyticus]
MGKSKKFPRAKFISLALQDMVLRARFASFKVVQRSHQLITWEGEIQPTDISEIYRVKIEYSQKEYAPKVWVVSPQLRSRGDDKIPHTYPGKRLCLYLPRTGEWSRDQLIAETFVPWTSLWLYYYEMWHATGQWLGGGVHHEGGEKSDA